MKTVGIGLLGCGTVGASVAERLVRERESLAQRTGVLFDLRAIAIRDSLKRRPPRLERELFTTSVAAVVERPDVDIVIELIGGISDAAGLIERALRLGRHVITANKDLLATAAHFAGLARESGASLRYDAAVGGAIPILRTIDETLAGEEIESVAGIINGTCTAILAQLEHGGEFGDALTLARRLGYAESDASNDIEGIDAAHKLALLARAAFGAEVRSTEIRRRGITAIGRSEIARARAAGLRIRLVGAALRTSHAILAEVGPVAVHAEHEFARASGADNAVAIGTRSSAELILRGQGAGGSATASSVIADLVSLLRTIADGTDRRPRPRRGRSPLPVEPLFRYLRRAPELPEFPYWDGAAINVDRRELATA